MNKLHLSGFGLKFQMACAVLCALLAPAAMAGPQQDADLAEKEFARGDLVAAMSLWRKAAQEGYAPAQARLGDVLDKAEEDQEAAEWYRKAAAQGNAAGEDGLGQMYAKGEGVKQDFEMARTYILRAAEKNYAPAVILMMDAYRNGGLGLSIDKAKADEWEAKVIALVPDYKKVQAKNAGKKGNTR